MDYDHAAFRCSQDVEGFLRRKGDAIDILVQPIDMDPESVARCDCLYDIVANVSAEAGGHVVTVYHRGDNINRSNGPERVGRVRVQVTAGD